MKINVTTMDKEYRQLSRKLAKTGWICHGYAQNRGPGAGGPCYQWSRKVRGKTVSVALSKEQFLWITKAIANWRNAQEILKSMEQLSLTMLFKTLPDATRRKPLSKKAMGTN